MSTVKLQGNTSGSGSVTLVSPNLSSDITVTLPNTTTTLSGVSTTAGDVGTYALMWRTSRTSATSGSTVAGSGLRFASTWADSSSVGYHSTAPTGTWRLMGSIGYYGTGSASSTTSYSGNYYAYQTSLYIRIS